jgi:hypothetical protein
VHKRCIVIVQSQASSTKTLKMLETNELSFNFRWKSVTGVEYGVTPPCTQNLISEICLLAVQLARQFTKCREKTCQVPHSRDYKLTRNMGLHQNRGTRYHGCDRVWLLYRPEIGFEKKHMAGHNWVSSPSPTTSFRRHCTLTRLSLNFRWMILVRLCDLMNLMLSRLAKL